MLYDEVRYAPQYKSLLDRVKGSWPIIGAPRHVGFLKGLLVGFNGKDRFSNPIWGALLILPPSAREALDNLLNQQVTADTTAGASVDDPYGHNTKYCVGDPIGISCGKIFEFDKESKLSGVSVDEINLDGGSNKIGSDGTVIENYGCRIYPGKKVLSLESKMDMVQKNDESFSDALWFMTGEEQINNLIIRGFGHTHRNLILYIFGSKGVLPKSFETGQRTVDMAAGRPAMQAPQNAPQAPRPQQDVEVEINLDGDGSSDSAPWGDDGVDNNVHQSPAEDPVFTPSVMEAPKEGPSTADSIRERLAAARSKTQ